ncbi:MAG: class I SAM-dependent methyltransferase [Candidatus Aenigmatarchaeota archaeon]
MPPSEYWDKTVKEMGESHLEFKIAQYKAKVHLELVKKWGSNLKDKRILKTDLFEEYFQRDSFFYPIDSEEKFGLDICKEIVTNVHKKDKNLKLCVTDVHRLPFEDESFDLIISNSTLDHIKKEWVSVALGEMKRILKPGGQLILTIDSRENPLYMLGLFLGQRLHILPFYQDRCYSTNEIREIIENLGLRIEDTDSIFHVIPPLSHLLAFFEKRNIKYPEFLYKKIIDVAEKLKNKKSKYITGRLLSFNIKK